MADRRIAIVLFNLGGPDEPKAVQPFLFNLFNDPAITRLPGLLRTPLAHLMSRRRGREAQDIYGYLGGGSPLLANTERQAAALEASLSSDMGAKVFVAMRYWHPMAIETAVAVEEYLPDEIILLPLYPQFSTTTTASSVRAWEEACRFISLSVPTKLVCCYPWQRGFVVAAACRIRAGYGRIAAHGTPRILFSAHGLPESVVRAGDPYQWQCEQTAAAIATEMAIPDLDWTCSYQSRVGPMKWIGPSTDEEIKRAGREGVPLVLFPSAFVSEHSETLVELDVEYRELAERSGVPAYERVQTVSDDPVFIEGLAGVVRRAVESSASAAGNNGNRNCPDGWIGCPCQKNLSSRTK